jgi:hypothetical protein
MVRTDVFCQEEVQWGSLEPTSEGWFLWLLLIFICFCSKLPILSSLKRHTFSHFFWSQVWQKSPGLTSMCGRAAFLCRGSKGDSISFLIAVIIRIHFLAIIGLWSPLHAAGSWGLFPTCKSFLHLLAPVSLPPGSKPARMDRIPLTLSGSPACFLDNPG